MTTPRLRSQRWFGGTDVNGFLHRAWIKAEGFSEDAFQGRPVIGIANSWSEATNCNAHLRTVAEHVKRGVWRAGGFPLEFPVISLSEPLMKPTTMLFRNLMSMDVEECIRSLPFDGVVLLSGCDKTTPAMLMGAASADLPAIMVTGGPMLRGMFGTEEVGSGTDVWRYWDEFRAGRLDEEAWCELESCFSRSAGHCMVMGTASTMASMAESLGMTLPGNAAIPAPDSRRLALAEATGRRIVEMVGGGPPPEPDPHARGVRERDPGGHGDRREHERDRPPAGDRGPRRRAAAALALRPAVAGDALHRQRPALREVPHGGLLLRGRAPGRPPRAPAAPPRRARRP